MPHSGYTICTSEQLPTSTTVSHGFVVEWYSSPPFGSHGPCKHSKPCPPDCGPGGPLRLSKEDTDAGPSGTLTNPPPGGRCLHQALLRCDTVRTTMGHGRLHGLLGPCFKTGRGQDCVPPEGGRAKLCCHFSPGPSRAECGRGHGDHHAEWCSLRAPRLPTATAREGRRGRVGRIR